MEKFTVKLIQRFPNGENPTFQDITTGGPLTCKDRMILFIQATALY